jgi:dipeptidyl aminopeptidase/acylaminoacyl peptidase
MKMLGFVASVVLLAQPGGGGFTLEQALSWPFPSGLVAAPGGARVAWVFDTQGRRNLWVAEGPQFQARQLTSYNQDDGQEITDLRFSPDGNWVVYVRGGNQNQAGEVPNPTSEVGGAKQSIFAVSCKDGQTRLLAEGRDAVISPAGDQVVFSKANQLWEVTLKKRSEPRQLFVARGNIGSPAFSPEGRRLAFVSSRGDHSFIGLYDTRGRTVRYLAPSVDLDGFPRWSPDGRRIAFIRQPARGSQPRSMMEDAPNPWAILVAEVASGGVREVWRSENTPAGSLPSGAGQEALRWGAGDRLVFASEQDGWMHLYAVPAEGGEATLLTPGACEVEHVAMTPDRRELVYSSNCDDIDRRRLWRVSVTGGKPATVTRGEGIEWSPVVTGDGKHLVYLGSDARQPGMPYAMPLAGGAGRMIAAAAAPKDFPSAGLVVPRAALFKSADELEIHGQLFLPRDAPAGARLPAVIFMHGGPVRQMLLGWHYLYYYHNAYAFNQYLTSRGYAVLAVNFRSGIGYGRAFRMAAKRGARGASEYQDIVAAAHYLRGREDIDPARIGLWGGSYGGYLTALGLARNSDLFAAGVDLHGVHDWSQRFSAGSWTDYRDPAAQKTARDASPVASVATWRSPVLLVHGDDDRNVAFTQTVDLVKRLREQKVSFEQLVFPDEVHDFLVHGHWIEAYRAAAEFFERRLGKK